MKQRIAMTRSKRYLNDIQGETYRTGCIEISKIHAGIKVEEGGGQLLQQRAKSLVVKPW